MSIVGQKRPLAVVAQRSRGQSLQRVCSSRRVRLRVSLPVLPNELLH